MSRRSSSLLAVVVASLAAAFPAAAQPLFSKSFEPETIAPGNYSRLTFTITNEGGSPVSGLAFNDTLPAGVVLASPASAASDCGPGATLGAPDGGTAISFSGGSMAGGASCTVGVDVTATDPGGYDNLSGHLTSTAGDSGSAQASLTVTSNRPTLSKSFDPAAVQLGADSRLTFSITNPTAGFITGVSFSDTLPVGLEISDPANLENSCNGNVTGATPGSTSLALSSGVMLPESSCTLAVDVTATGTGELVNRSGSLTSTQGPSGFAVAVLSASADVLALEKEFLGDPQPPGATLPLRLTLHNLDREQQATGISFTDDLDAALSGMVAVPPFPTDPCGAGSTLTGTSLLTLTGGNLGAGETCVFEVEVEIPSGATPGVYPNTTSTVTAAIGGVPEEGAPATDSLHVAGVLLTKTFLDDPVTGGNEVTIELTLTNASSATLTNGLFTDAYASQLSGATVVSAPSNGYCGGGSAHSDVDGVLTFGGMRLAGGESCTFSVTLQLAVNIPPGTYINTTSTVSGTLGGEEEVSGPPASDELTVVGGPTLSKEFLADPVLPGDAVDLRFTISAPAEGSSAITDIAFTDDLSAALAGLTAISLPADGFCGPSSQVTGTSTLNVSGAEVAGAGSCSFTVTLQVPAGALPGSYTNTTSETTGTSEGLAVTGSPAADDLDVGAVTFAKSFNDDPTVAGGSVTLQFSLANLSSTADVTDASFTDDLDATLSGLQVSGALPIEPCGTGSSLGGTSLLVLTGGNLPPGGSCAFAVTLAVPAGTAAGQYANATSLLSAQFDGNPVQVPPARDELQVLAPLSIAKEFVDDPVGPGGSATLRFTLTNDHPSEPASDLGFSDDLDAVLTGLVATGLPASGFCGGGSTISGSGTLTVSGASLAASSSCTLDVTVEVPADAAGGSYVNTTSTLSGTIDGEGASGPPASATLVVAVVDLAKSFTAHGAAGGTVVLSFSLENLSSGSGVGGLAFTDDLGAVLPGLVAVGLPMSGVCGPGSQIGGSGLLTLSGGSLDPGGSCSFAVTVQIPADAVPGSYLNQTSALTASGLEVDEPASDSLIVEPPPGFAKRFTPTVVPETGISTLVFTLDNTASATAATGLSFSDALPAGVVVAATPNASTTCTGGTLTATAGSGSISYGGGSVAAGAACTVQADVTSAIAATYVNTSGALTSSLGDSGTASDTLEVVGGEFAISKTFTDPVLPGGAVDVQFTIVTAAAFGVSGVAFADDLGAALPGLAAVGLPVDGFCGPSSQLTGSSVLSLTGAALGPGSTCSFSAILAVPAGAAVGVYTNTTSSASGIRTGGAPTTADPATAPLEVAFLGLTKAFAESTVNAGSTTTLSFTLTNPDAVNAASMITFSDDLDAAVPGMVAVDLPQSDVCGAGSQLTGTSLVTLTGASLPAGGSCSFTITVQVPSNNPGGAFENVTSAVDAEVGGGPVAGPPASAASADLQIVPSVVAIPTLSFWGLLALGLMVGWMGWRRLG